MTIKTICPNLACEASIQVEFTPGQQAQTYGPPERCHDGSGDECDPDTCPECGAKLDVAKIREQAVKAAEEDRTEWELARARWPL